MHSLQHASRLALLSLFSLSPLLAQQFDVDGAQVISYFPQLADGGGAGQQWFTKLTFVNSHDTSQADGIVFLYHDDGSPLALDFGNGPTSSFNFQVPPQGTVQFASTGKSPQTVTGWAIVGSSLPLSGVVQFHYSVKGVPQQGVAAQSTPASELFRSPATYSTGIAVANPSASPINVYLSALDAGGKAVANSSLPLPAFGHRSFNLSQILPSVPSTFQGSIIITTDVQKYLVAWTLSADSGVLASYPPSDLAWPISQKERIWKTWGKLLDAASQFVAASGGALRFANQPKLIIDYSTAQINSYAVSATNEVHVFINLAELISDSESELAFVVAHELGHIIQYQNGRLILTGNIESDADAIGMLLVLVAGYDPYGAAGALAKLAMASGTADLVNQNFDNLLADLGLDPHASFSDRIARIFDEMQTVCGLQQVKTFCNTYKSVVHPHLPPTAPLTLRGSAR